MNLRFVTEFLISRSEAAANNRMPDLAPTFALIDLMVEARDNGPVSLETMLNLVAANYFEEDEGDAD